MKSYVFNVLAAFVVMSLAVAFVAGCSKSTDPVVDTNIVNYNVAIKGENSVPALSNTGSGTLVGTYNKTTKALSYTLTWTLTNSAIATLAHFHGPVAATSTAGVRVTIFSAQNTTGSITGTATLDATMETELLAGLWYCNLHSTLNAGGALRGQMIATP